MARDIGAASIAVFESRTGFCIVRGGKSHVRRAVSVADGAAPRPVMAGPADVLDSRECIVDAMTSRCRGDGVARNARSDCGYGSGRESRMAGVASGSGAAGQVDTMAEGAAVPHVTGCRMTTPEG